MKYRMIKFEDSHPFFPDEVDAMMAAEHVFLDTHKPVSKGLQDLGVRELVKIDVASVPGVRTFKHKRHLWFFKDQFEEISEAGYSKREP